MAVKPLSIKARKRLESAITRKEEAKEIADAIDAGGQGGGGGSSTWGAITGTLSNQTDLNTQLTSLIKKDGSNSPLFVGTLSDNVHSIGALVTGSGNKPTKIWIKNNDSGNTYGLVAFPSSNQNGGFALVHEQNGIVFIYNPSNGNIIFDKTLQINSSLDMNGNTLINVPTPNIGTDAANADYVNNQIAAIPASATTLAALTDITDATPLSMSVTSTLASGPEAGQYADFTIDGQTVAPNFALHVANASSSEIASVIGLIDNGDGLSTLQLNGTRVLLNGQQLYTTFAGLSDLSNSLPSTDVFISRVNGNLTADKILNATSSGAISAIEAYDNNSGGASFTASINNSGSGQAQIAGAISLPLATYSGAYNALYNANYHDLLSNPSNPIAVDQNLVGTLFIVKNSSGVTLTVAANSGETFDGNSTKDLLTGNIYLFIGNGGHYAIQRLGVEVPTDTPLQATFTLSPTDIAALSVSGYTLVDYTSLPSPGTTIIVPIALELYMASSVTPYTTTANFFLNVSGNYPGSPRWPAGNTTNNGNIGMMTSNDRNEYRYIPIDLHDFAGLTVAQSVILWADDTIVGGDGTLNVRLTYKLVTIPFP